MGSRNVHAGRSGYGMARHMRRWADKKGGLPKEDPFQGADPESLAGRLSEYLLWLETHNHSLSGIESRRRRLITFWQWAQDRDLFTPERFTRAILESYQRHLWRYRKKNGRPLGISSQRDSLYTIKGFFSWLCKQRYLQANPASELEAPRAEKRLPVEALSRSEIQSVLNVPDIKDPLGLRERAMLEIFYSTGIRRAELVRLQTHDIHREKHILYVRQGKGKKDRVVPVGKRAMDWVERYLDQSRPLLLIDSNETTLFLTGYGTGFSPDALGRIVTKIIHKAEIGRTGSCHLLRHTCATHMLENGADIRYIQQLLGHENLDTTAIYTQVNISELQAVHARTHPAERQ